MNYLSGLVSWLQGIILGQKDQKNVPIGSVKSVKKPSIPSSILSVSPLGTFTVGQITLFWFIGLGVVYLGYLAFQSLSLLYLIITAWIISIAIESFIVGWQRWMPRGLAIGLSYVLFLLFILAGIVIIIPFVFQQVSNMIGMVVQNFYAMQSQIGLLGLDGYIQSLGGLPNFMKSYLLDALSNGSAQELQSTLISNLSTIVSTGSNYAKQLAGLGVSAITGLFSFLGQVGLVLTIAVFFSLEKDTVIYVLTHRIAQEKSITYRTQKLDLLYIKMGLRLKSQLGLCVYIAIIVYIVLRILHLFGIALPNKLVLALIAGFTEFIPYIGPLLGGIPALIIGTSLYGLPGMFAVGIAYYVIQWTENNILIPMLMKKSLGVSPLLIFLCVLLGGSLLGFIGVVLAVPFAVIVTLLLDKDFE